MPASAIQRNDKGAYVWVVRSDSTAAMQTVRAGETLGDKVLVDTGLAAGQEVVTDGQFGLTPGAHVKVIRSASPAARTLKDPAPDTLGLTP